MKFSSVRFNYRRGRHIQLAFDVGTFHARRPPNPDGDPNWVKFSARSAQDTARTHMSTARTSRNGPRDYTFEFDQEVVDTASGAGVQKLTPKEVSTKLDEILKKYPPKGFLPVGALHKPMNSKTVRNHDRAKALRARRGGGGNSNRISRLPSMSTPYPAPFRGPARRSK